MRGYGLSSVSWPCLAVYIFYLHYHSDVASFYILCYRVVAWTWRRRNGELVSRLDCTLQVIDASLAVSSSALLPVGKHVRRVLCQPVPHASRQQVELWQQMQRQVLKCSRLGSVSVEMWQLSTKYAVTFTGHSLLLFIFSGFMKHLTVLPLNLVYHLHSCLSSYLCLKNICPNINPLKHTCN
jgi:hypothetical protein